MLLRVPTRNIAQH